MKEWLLKEEKNPVGRPKLADESILKKAKITIVSSLILCFILSFYLASELLGVSPFKLVYHVTLEKVFGAIENKNGFLVDYTYDNNYNYVLEFNVPSSVDKYSGSYKYTLYEMKNNIWKEVENKEIQKDTKNFKVTIDSLKNQNKIWKMKLQIINGAKIDKSYAPAGWNFVEADTNADMYAYKIFTVKGYYSPVTLSEIKESNKSKDKITVLTKKQDPRSLFVSFPNDESYDIKVIYTDNNSKNVELAYDKAVSKNKVYKIPNLTRVSKVTIKIYGDNVSSLKLSNWQENIDSKGNTYITNTYILKPESAY